MGLIPGSSPGSRSRNLFSLFIFALGALLSIELFWSFLPFVGLTPTPFATGGLALLGFVYFFATTFGVMYLLSQGRARVAPGRLLRDVALSIFYSVISFAVFYKTAGIIATFDSTDPATGADALYFSVVTFSTLGYGDFRPQPDARILAAAQALLGTIHIGMIVGAAFLTATHPPHGETGEAGRNLGGNLDRKSDPQSGQSSEKTKASVNLPAEEQDSGDGHGNEGGDRDHTGKGVEPD